MKKIFFALTAVILLVSCGSKVDYSAINDKIEKGQSLTKSEYSAMIDYIVEANECLSKTSNFQELEKFAEKYPYSGAFTEALGSADESMLSSSDLKKLEKLSADLDKAFESLEFEEE